MTQEDKNLLLKDLCARLPYGVFCSMGLDYPLPLQRLFVDKLDEILLDFYEDGKDYQVYLSEVKPYLRPMSSMTEKEKEELKREFCVDIREEDNGRHTETYGYITIYHNFKGESWYIPFEAMDWLNKHHFDYRNLIGKGLALEAPEDMYK